MAGLDRRLLSTAPVLGSGSRGLCGFFCGQRGINQDVAPQGVNKDRGQAQKRNTSGEALRQIAAGTRRDRDMLRTGDVAAGMNALPR